MVCMVLVVGVESREALGGGKEEELLSKDILAPLGGGWVGRRWNGRVVVVIVGRCAGQKKKAD